MRADRDTVIRRLVADGGPRGMADPAVNARVRAWLREHPMTASAPAVAAGPLRTETDAQAFARVAAPDGVGGLPADVLDSMTAAARAVFDDVLTRRRTADVYRQSALKGWYVR